MNHQEIIKRYAERKINSRTQTIEWSGSNVFCHDGIIYSYGSHFPMAVYIGGKLCEFVVNSDKYSVSTSRHQGIVGSLCRGPALPNYALRNVGVPFTELTAKNILFWREGFSKFAFRNKAKGTLHEMPKGQTWQDNIYGLFKPTRSQAGVETGYETGWFSVDQVVVLYWKRKYFLLIKNEITRLSKKPTSIPDALEMVALKKSDKLVSQFGTNILAGFS